MTTLRRSCALAAFALSIVGCKQETAITPTATMPLTQADGEKVANAFIAELSSLDGARIKAVYDPAVAGFNTDSAPLASDRATWDKNEEGFIAAKFDRITSKDRKIQILGSDIVVLSGTWDLASTVLPTNVATVRCTDVFHRGTAGKWLVINEHCSIVPKPA